MKRILIATDSFLPRWDGIASFLNVIIPQLRKDYSLAVVAPDFGEFKGHEHVSMLRFPTKRFQFADYHPCWPSYRKIREAVKQTDVVWTQSIGPVGAMAIIAGRFAKKPVVAYIHSIEWELVTNSLATKGIRRWLLRGLVRKFTIFMYNRCSMLMVPSVEVAELLKKSGVSTQKKVIYLGVDTARFVPTDKPAAKNKLDINPETLVIGYCGRLGLEKDLITLYRAFHRLRRHNPDVLLLIVGAGNKKLDKLFRDKPAVRAVGAKDNVVPYLQAMDIYVLPSLTETTSLSTLEAMACGLTVVSTPVGYVKSYIENGKNGLLVPTSDSVKLYMTLRQLEEDKTERQRLAFNARRSVVEQFSWENTLEQIRNVFNVF